MIKKLTSVFLTILCSICLYPLNAQNANLILPQSSGIVRLFSIDVDNQGNTYVFGYQASTFNIGSGVRNTSTSSDNFFVAKLDNTGKWLWLNSFDCSRIQDAHRIKLDRDGNIYIVGMFENKLDFGTFSLRSIYSAGNSFAGFIAKLDNDGNWLWAKASTSPNIESSAFTDITITKENDCYLSGFFTREVQIDTNTLSTTSRYAPIIAKIDKDGNWKWAKSPKVVTGDSRAWAIDCANPNEIFIAGRTTHPVIFGTDTAGGTNNFFVSAVDSTGNWIKSMGSKSLRENSWLGSIDIAADNNGGVILAGGYQGPLVFGPDTVQMGHFSRYNAFIAKFDVVGGWLWAKDFGTFWGGGSENSKIVRDAENNFYVTGNAANYIVFENDTIYDTYLLKIDPNGKLLKYASEFRFADIYDAINDIAISNNKIAFCGEVDQDFYFRDSLFKLNKNQAFCGTIETRTASVQNLVSSQMLVYPNPTSGLVHIYLDNELLLNSTISVFDSRGTPLEVEKRISANLISLDLSGQPKGVYFLEIRNKNGRKTEKIVMY
jgi:hypothetical protein